MNETIQKGLVLLVAAVFLLIMVRAKIKNVLSCILGDDKLERSGN